MSPQPTTTDLTYIYLRLLQTQLKASGRLPYSGLFSRRLYFANFAKAQPILENKNLERQKMWEEAW